MADLEPTERAVIGDPGGTHTCPTCGHERLRVDDQSVRPMMLWLEISCPACGFRHMVNAPMSAGGT
jgi:DNA-directed RNA polymerase subunit RPC12/RpoP